MQSIANLFSLNPLRDVIIDNCEDIVTVKDIDMKYVFCNKAFLRLLGLKDKVNVIDKQINEIFDDKNSKIINGNCEIIKQTMDSKSFVFEVEKDFCSRIVKTTSYPILKDGVLNGILSVSKDFDKDEEAKNKIIEKFKLVNSFLENIPILAYIKDFHNNYIVGTKYSKEFFQYGIDYYAGNIKIDLKNSANIIAEEDRYVIKNKKVLIKEITLKSIEGTEHWYKIYKSPVYDEQKGISGIITLVQNIDEDKKLEVQKELFLATMTHDLKNLLQAQISSLQLLSKGKFGTVSEKQKEILDMINESSSFMREMIYSILSTYKYENGMVKLNKVNFNIDELIKTCIEEAQFLAQEKNIVIEYKRDSDISIVNADEGQIRRVLSNILNNGINYAYKNTKIIITFIQEEETVSIKIKNTSEPIPENMKHCIFDKYVAGSSSTCMSGIGLGLYFCKKVIDAHNGKIRLNADNTENEFIIELPKMDKEHLVVDFM